MTHRTLKCKSGREGFLVNFGLGVSPLRVGRQNPPILRRDDGNLAFLIARVDKPPQTVDGVGVACHLNRRYLVQIVGNLETAAGGAIDFAGTVADFNDRL